MIPLSLIRPVRQFATAWRAWRDEVRTEFLIDNLPGNIRKDIGWPDVKARRRGARYSGDPL